jgi:uncharacterized membrane protein YfcA
VIPSLLLAAVAAFLVGVLGGFTGFGISVVLVPLLLVVYDKPTVVVLNGMLSATIAAAVARDSWRKADRPAALLLTLAVLPRRGAVHGLPHRRLGRRHRPRGAALD